MSARSRTAMGFVLAGLLVQSACHVGSDPSRSPSARSPHGLDIIVEMETGVRLPNSSRGSEVRGELLAVRDSALLVAVGSGVILFPFPSFVEARPQDAPGTEKIRGRAPDSVALRKLRQYARHPFGLDEDQLRQLLERMGQDSLVVVGRSGGPP